MCEGEAGHSGDTSDSQSSDNKDAACPHHAEETGLTASSPEAAEEPKQVQVVTRAGQWMDSLARETEIRRESETEPLSELVREAIELPSIAETEEPVAEVQDEVSLAAAGEESREDFDLGCPEGMVGGDLVKLKAEMMEDESLKHCWDLAREEKMGYSVVNGCCVTKS